MAKIDGLTFDLYANICVSDETAETCVALLNAYFKQTQYGMEVKQDENTGVIEIKIHSPEKPNNLIVKEK